MGGAPARYAAGAVLRCAVLGRRDGGGVQGVGAGATGGARAAARGGAGDPLYYRHGMQPAAQVRVGRVSGQQVKTA